MKQLTKSLKILRTPRFILIVGLFAAYFFGWIFSEIAEKIWLKKETFLLDKAIEIWINEAQHPFIREVFLFVSKLGSISCLVTIVFTTSCCLYYLKKHLENFMLLSGFLATLASVVLIKYFSERKRPYSELSLLENTMSFPSGHMAHSLFVYGFLAYLASKCVKQKIHAISILVSGIGLASLIGLSRLYLNVHWLSDILGGFSLATAFLCLCIGIIESAHSEKQP